MIKIIGIPFDEKSSFQKGTRLAPPLIRKALHSGAMNLYSESGFSLENNILKDAGDFKVSSYFEIEKISAAQLQGSTKIVTLGGDHSITFPVIKAFYHKYGPMDLLHIDAHADLYDVFEGDRFSHACPFARIMENGFANRLVQIGIRTLNPEQRTQAQKFNVEVHEMRHLDLSALPKFQKPVYISLDMDAFDPAFAPGVSHHEPGGLTSREVITLLQNLDGDVLGADIVEYNPLRDFQEMTAYLAAKMLKEIVSKMAENE
ncbi:agmatinase [Arenibacter sp. GZD96]|uniref:agmatinase n=1 Tax=Aurantibrevibacter litoralis TaxID=3106030 RepID=UPI002AFF3745|nr:agmatinase [Arenibacter sp. GZD-96]MEA1786489.1 agmatinase [Arenibacter sp. GZD-96]